MRTRRRARGGGAPRFRLSYGYPSAQRTAELPDIGGTAAARWGDLLITGPSSPLVAAAVLVGAMLLAAALAFGAYQALDWLTARAEQDRAPVAAAPESTRATIYTIAPPPRPTPAPTVAAAVGTTPTPEAETDAGGAPAETTAAGIARILIPDVGIDAPVVVKGLDAHRVMEAPELPFEVAWYDFTGFPGHPGNAVFSGHLDFPVVGPAAFWQLPQVEEGHVVEVILTDGTTYQYRVVSKTVYREETAPVAQIVGSTPTESITLITCAGNFDRTVGRYEDRLVVRAERVA